MVPSSQPTRVEAAGRRVDVLRLDLQPAAAALARPRLGRAEERAKTPSCAAFWSRLFMAPPLRGRRHQHALATVNACIRKAGEDGIALPPDTILRDPAGRLVTDGALGNL